VNDFSDTAPDGISCLHAEIVIEELCRNGVSAFFVSPGARCIPLVLALERRSDVAVHLVNDERSAAFAAQGYGRAGRAACLISTSGTAVQNYLPGVTEAFFSRVPLIVLTADRPYELLYGRANQTIWQKDTFRDVCCLSIDIPAPETKLYPEALLADIDQAVAATHDQQLPVHLNLAYRKPFIPAAPQALDPNEVAILERWRKSALAFTSYVKTERSLDMASSAKIVDLLNSANSPLIVCGPLESAREKEAVAELALELCCPIIADINSDLRFSSAQDQVFGLYNLYLRALERDEKFPDVILLCGDRIVSEEVRMYLLASDATVIAATAYSGRQDLIENESVRTHFKVSAPLSSLLVHCKSKAREHVNTTLLEEFSGAEERAKESLLPFLVDCEGMGEAAAVKTVFDTLSDGMAVYLSASLLFREADFFVAPRSIDLLTSCNRGATGIDGVLSSAIGFSLSSRRPTAVLIGEQALLHDLNSLAMLTDCPSTLYVFLVKNGGGAIFDFFDLGDSNQTMRNCQSVSFEDVSSAFKLRYRKPRSLNELEMEFKKAQESPGCVFFELETEGNSSVERVKSAPFLLL
jgi:2-succinyl-5-enolpyruvyl-6-hydroxy-3-cyclohexene-1-carboxylate synthase